MSTAVLVHQQHGLEQVQVESHQVEICGHRQHQEGEQAVQGKKKEQDYLAQQLGAICSLCPDFLLAPVLKDMLFECVAKFSSDELVAVYHDLSTRPHQSKGFVLGLKALLGCVKDGSAEAFFDRLDKMGPAEIAVFRSV